MLDRSEGGASLTDGQLELMIHRRLFHDDQRGVGEALNETESGCTECDDIGATYRGTHVVSLTPTGSTQVQRQVEKSLANPLVLGFADASRVVSPSTYIEEGKRSVLGSNCPAIPANLNLMTLNELADGTVLLRLDHMYGVGEDPVLSKPASVDISDIFCGHTVGTVTEMSLTTNQLKTDMKRLKWRTDTVDQEASRAGMGRQPPFDNNSDGFSVTLNPFDIRTFIVALTK